MLKILKIIWFALLIWFFYYINNFSEKEVILEKKWNDKIVQQVGFSPLINDFCQQFIDKWYYYKVWSDTSPQINETHIFCGEINSRWKPTWFHAKINWKIPKTIKIVKTENKNKLWVFNAKIEVYDIKNKIFKNKFSSIFPENLSKEQVEKAILNAWDNKKYYKNSKFEWPSGLWFQISGYTYKWKNKINTAYPIYKK